MVYMLSQDELKKLVSAKIITLQQARNIAAFYRKEPSTNPLASEGHAFSFSNVLYYIGGFLIVFAISYFLGTNWEELGDAGRIGSTLVFSILFLYLGIRLRNSGYKTAGAIMLLCATVAIPLLIHSIERAVGIWPVSSYGYGDKSYNSFLGYINTAWVILDVVTLVSCIVMFQRFREPILTLPISHFFWFLMLDALAFLTNNADYSDYYHSWKIKSWITIIAGSILVMWGQYYHQKRDNRVGVWPWIYGLAIVLGALVTLRWVSSDAKLLYQILILAFGLTVLIAATKIKSRTFLTFGAIALFWFIQDIAWTYFRESLGFSVVLIISGLLTIGYGIIVQKYYKKQFSNQ